MTTTRKCEGECGETKPLEAFAPIPNGKGRHRKCERCRGREAYAKRAGDLDRKLASRAYHRTMSEAAGLYRVDYPDHWKAMYDRHLAAAKAEAEATAGANLMPGPRMAHETEADRIAKVCQNCAGHHRLGHACTVCGSTPDHQADIISIASLATGEARFPKGQTTVVKP